MQFGAELRGLGGREDVVGIRAECLRNPRWSATNSLYSFWLARDWVKGDVVVLNCDVLFSPRVLERLLDAPGDALAYDSGSGDLREQMSVRVEDGLLRDMSKTMSPEQVSGENVGIVKLTAVVNDPKTHTARFCFQYLAFLSE